MEAPFEAEPACVPTDVVFREERTLGFSEIDSLGVEVASTIMLEVGTLGIEPEVVVCDRVLTGDKVLGVKTLPEMALPGTSVEAELSWLVRYEWGGES